MPPEPTLMLELRRPATAIITAAPTAWSDARSSRSIALLALAQRRLQQNDAAGAERLLRRALDLVPEHPDALNLMSVALGRRGQAVEGEACSRRALGHRPQDPGFRHNLGLRLVEQGRREDALDALRAAHRGAPSNPIFLRVLARTLGELQRWDEAVGVAGRALACRPEHAETLIVAARILAVGGRPEDALALFERAVELAPERIDWWLDFARVCHRTERIDDGARALEKVIEAAPEHAEARTMLASMHLRRRDYTRLEETLTGLRAQGTDAANAVNLTGMMLVARGQVEDGLDAMRLVDEIAPLAHELQMTRLMYLNYDPRISAEDLFRAHRSFGERFKDMIAPLPPQFDASPEPERRLRIGYLSPDFRAHSVAYFTAPVFEAHDREGFEIVAYAHLNKPDQVSEHLKARVCEWHDITTLDDQKLARKIRDDRIDVLVELAGFTANSRLLALTARPAPVQISYLGYPNTTGLPQIDYRITDGIADPDDADELHTETLIRLPRPFLCYAIPEHAPAVAPPPFERNGHITFGSFNSLNKVNREVVRLWAEVLKAVPGSRLLMKSLATGDPKAKAHLEASFAAHGVDRSRLDLVDYTAGLAEHMAVYNEVDIALDTFPYNGTTTTCEALWMGVPVVTLMGDRHPARVSASLLSAIGFTAGIAGSFDEYVATARLMAAHPDLIRAARRSLRADLCRSPLCDMHGHARALEEAYRVVWRMWRESMGPDRALASSAG